MNIFSKIRYYITEFFVGTFDAIWEYFFGSDQDKTKSKEFEASIILNERQEDTFLSKNKIEQCNSTDQNEILGEPFEILSDTDI